MSGVMVVLGDGETWEGAFLGEILMLTEEGWEAHEQGEWEDPRQLQQKYVKHRVPLGTLVEEWMDTLP
jgi:hypothetical protein